MPIDYDPHVIESFFGSPGEITESPGTAERTLSVCYTGPTLKCVLTLHLDSEAVYICGDSVRHFGTNTLYEICVPCTSVAATNAGGMALSFFCGGSDVNRHRRLTILKDNAGDLIVWPSYPFPPGHKYHIADDRE